MQKVTWCDFKGLEYTLSQGWTIENILLNERALNMAGSAPFFVVFNIPEPTPEPEPKPEPATEPKIESATIAKLAIGPEPKRKSLIEKIDFFGLCSLVFVWGFFLGLVVMGMMMKR